MLANLDEFRSIAVILSRISGKKRWAPVQSFCTNVRLASAQSWFWVEPCLSDISNLTPPTFISVPLQKNFGRLALQESWWQLSTWFNIFTIFKEETNDFVNVIRMWRAFNPQSCLLLVAVASAAPTADEAGHLSEVRSILKNLRCIQ